jgi:hypothetical protein
VCKIRRILQKRERDKFRERVLNNGSRSTLKVCPDSSHITEVTALCTRRLKVSSLSAYLRYAKEEKL